ncbi:hypothetical protein V8C86DRAFT_1110825 [Haematococcus lacustris]
MHAQQGWTFLDRAALLLLWIPAFWNLLTAALPLVARGPYEKHARKIQRSAVGLHVACKLSESVLHQQMGVRWLSPSLKASLLKHALMLVVYQEPLDAFVPMLALSVTAYQLVSLATPAFGRAQPAGLPASGVQPASLPGPLAFGLFSTELGEFHCLVLLTALAVQRLYNWLLGCPQELAHLLVPQPLPLRKPTPQPPAPAPPSSIMHHGVRQGASPSPPPPVQPSLPGLSIAYRWRLCSIKLLHALYFLAIPAVGLLPQVMVGCACTVLLVHMALAGWGGRYYVRHVRAINAFSLVVCGACQAVLVLCHRWAAQASGPGDAAGAVGVLQRLMFHSLLVLQLSLSAHGEPGLPHCLQAVALAAVSQLLSGVGSQGSASCAAASAAGEGGWLAGEGHWGLVAACCLLHPLTLVPMWSVGPVGEGSRAPQAILPQARQLAPAFSDQAVCHNGVKAMSSSTGGQMGARPAGRAEHKAGTSDAQPLPEPHSSPRAIASHSACGDAGRSVCWGSMGSDNTRMAASFHLPAVASAAEEAGERSPPCLAKQVTPCPSAPPHQTKSTAPPSDPNLAHCLNPSLPQASRRPPSIPHSSPQQVGPARGQPLSAHGLDLSPAQAAPAPVLEAAAWEPPCPPHLLTSTPGHVPLPLARPSPRPSTHSAPQYPTHTSPTPYAPNVPCQPPLLLPSAPGCLRTSSSDNRSPTGHLGGGASTLLLQTVDTSQLPAVGTQGLATSPSRGLRLRRFQTESLHDPPSGYLLSAEPCHQGLTSQSPLQSLTAEQGQGAAVSEPLQAVGRPRPGSQAVHRLPASLSLDAEHSCARRAAGQGSPCPSHTSTHRTHSWELRCMISAAGKLSAGQPDTQWGRGWDGPGSATGTQPAVLWGDCRSLEATSPLPSSAAFLLTSDHSTDSASPSATRERLLSSNHNAPPHSPSSSDDNFLMHGQLGFNHPSGPPCLPPLPLAAPPPPSLFTAQQAQLILRDQLLLGIEVPLISHLVSWPLLHALGSSMTPMQIAACLAPASLYWVGCLLHAVLYWRRPATAFRLRTWAWGLRLDFTVPLLHISLALLRVGPSQHLSPLRGLMVITAKWGLLDFGDQLFVTTLPIKVLLFYLLAIWRAARAGEAPMPVTDLFLFAAWPAIAYVLMRVLVQLAASLTTRWRLRSAVASMQADRLVAAASLAGQVLMGLVLALQYTQAAAHASNALWRAFVARVDQLGIELLLFGQEGGATQGGLIPVGHSEGPSNLGSTAATILLTVMVFVVVRL